MKIATSIKYILISIIILALSSLIIIECLYRCGLALVPNLPAVNYYAPLPSVVADAVWASFYEEGPTHVASLLPWNIITHLVLGYESPGEKIIDYISRKLLDVNKSPPHRMIIHHLQVFSFGIWISRNWTTEQTVNEAANQISYNNIKGIEAMANQFFNKSVNSLYSEEIALLMAVAKGNFIPIDDHLIEQLTKRRNIILERMFTNKSISARELKESINQSISQTWFSQHIH